MDSKKILKDLIERTVAGDFDYVFNYITTLQKPLEETEAIKFIIACCNACNNNLSTPNNLNEEDLVTLLKCLLKFIKMSLREQCDNYLQSVYFIMKLLVEKKSIKSIIQLEELLMPKFMPLIFTEKQTFTHLNICKVISNAIVRISNAKEKQFRPYIITLCCILCLLYRKVHNVSKLMDSVHNNIICLATLNVEAQELMEFYTFSLDLLDERDTSVYHLLMNNFSCLYAHLLKMKEFETAETCYNCTVTKIEQIFNTREHLPLADIFEIVRWLNPVCTTNSTEILTNALIKLSNYYKMHKSITNLQSICDVISSVVCVILQYYIEVDKKWTMIPTEVQLKLFEFLCNVSHIMAKTPHQCFCKTCPTKTNIYEAVRILTCISGLGHLYIAKNPTVDRNYKVEVFRYLKKLVEHVHTLKTNKCPKWATSWYRCGEHLYKIGVALEVGKDFDMCTVFMRKYVDSVCYIEGTNPQILEKEYVLIAMTVIADCWLELKEYEKCLLIIACAMIWGGGKDLINRWIRAKVACRDSSVLENEEIQELTVISVCQKHNLELSTDFPNSEFEIDRKKQIELLVQELNGYKLKWKSKVPMMATYRHLTQLADSTTQAKIFIEIWGDGELKAHDDIPILLRNTIKKLDADTTKNRSLKVKFYLSCLYFLQHKYRVKDTIIKHCDEMERTINMSKLAPQTGKAPPDPNEECDIVSSYDCLKLSHYLAMIKDLNKSLDMITELFSEIVETLPEKSYLFRLLIKIGHEYSLHSYAAKALQAFELALKLAEFENNQINFFQAGTFILELSDVNKPLVKNLVHKLDEIAYSIREQKSNFVDLMMYFLSKAEAFFYADFNTCYKAFRQASILWEYCEETSILKAKYYLLHHKLIMCPCKFNVDGHEEYSLVRIHEAQNSAFRHYKENLDDSAYDMRIFFEVCENLVKMYHEMRLPREVRCYGKEIVTIAQKMVLPLRTTSLLFYLANADVNSSRLDDCKVKVEGMSDILILSNYKPLKSQNFQEKGTFDQVMDNLNVDFGEIMLDVPARNSRPTSLGSPSLAMETFQLPSFLTHEDGCTCFYCTWVEYHQAVLKKTCLHALLYEHERDLSLAKDFFSGCVKMYECFKSKSRSYVEKTAKKMSEDLVPFPLEAFSVIYCTILFHYTNFFLRAGKLNEGDTLNRKIFDKIELLKTHSVHLHNEVLAQKLDILVEQSMFPKRVNGELQPPVDLNSGVKTPENHQSTVVVSPRCSPRLSPKVKMMPKSIKFDLSDDEDDDNLQTAKKTTKNLPTFLQVPKTPAPSSSKIKIYTNPKSAKKKKAPVEVPTEKYTRESDFLIPESPDAYTPSSKKVEAQLANRTKLLTEKLKSSSRKVGSKGPSVAVTDENPSGEGCSQDGGTQTRRLRKVRQNLLSEMESTENGEQGGTVRRSGRNKK